MTVYYLSTALFSLLLASQSHATRAVMEGIPTTNNVVFISSTSSAFARISRLTIGSLTAPTTTQLDVYGSLRLSSGITTMGGNARGANAQDLQLTRTNVAEVASGVSSTIGGGVSNKNTGSQAVIGGGSGNYIITNGDYSTIAGGSVNTISATYSFIGGGNNNTVGANTSGAVICGGNTNSLDDVSDPTIPSTIAGGKNNAANNGSTVGGGRSNNAQNTSTIAGGYNNSCSNQVCAVGGGQSNTCSGSNCVIGGGNSNTAAGQYSVVPGGIGNKAYGLGSTAAGTGSVSSADGAYTLTDSVGTTLNNGSTDTYKARFAGGYNFTGGATTVTYIYGNGSGLTGLPAASESNTFASSKTFSGAGGILVSGAAAPTAYAITFSSANGVVVFGVTGGGHMVSSGTIPSISCNAGSPAMLPDSNDTSGEFTGGAASANCTVTFVTAWAKKPRCWCQDGTNVLALKATTTTTTLVCTAAVSIGTDAVMYGCVGAP